MTSFGGVNEHLFWLWNVSLLICWDMLVIDSSFCSTLVRSKAHLSNQLAVIFFFLWPRFEKRRVQEELEALNTKLTRLSSHHEGGPAVELLQEEIKGYKTIIKCGVCHDRNKEVLLWTHK